jgi:uncharacterized protein
MTTEQSRAASLRLAETAEQNGGPYQEPEAYRGSCARTMFDRSGAKDGTVTVLVPEEDIAGMPRQALVKIRSYDRKAKQVEADYIGMVVAGPFAEPDAMNADAPTLKVPAVHRAVLTPKFHGVADVEIMGVEVDRAGSSKRVLIPAQRRPCPNSPVFMLEAGRTEEVLGLTVALEDKPVRLGLMEGAADVNVYVPANRKLVLPRHLGVLGTTGGGKSTTISGLVARLAGSGNAIVLFDTEGEYAAMCEATDDPVMLAALEERGLRAAGAPNTHLYMLQDCEPAYPEHKSKKFFKLDFADISIHVLTEILDLPEAQERRLIDAYDVCKIVMERTDVFPAPRNAAEAQQALDVDELETGWPKMTIEMLLDVISGAIAHCQKLNAFEIPPQYFRGQEDVVFKAISERKLEAHKPSWLGLAKKLWKLKRANIFGQGPRSVIDVDEMLAPGRISIVDLSDMDAPYLRNIVIAQILRRLQSCQDAKYKDREAKVRRKEKADPLVPVNIFIEEAHEFLSDRRISQMPNLFEQVVRIARRGRKRHLGLVFITQLPGHLPDEVLGLINNWILHKIGDANVIQRLRKIVGGVPDGTWGSLSNLAPGHALAAFAHMTRPVLVTVDPTPCKLLMVE